MLFCGGKRAIHKLTKPISSLPITLGATSTKLAIRLIKFILKCLGNNQEFFANETSRLTVESAFLL